MSGMEVTVTDVQINGSQADVTAAITPKGGNASAGMSIKYHLEQRDSKWVVTGRPDSGSSPHGAGVAPGGENPHGGGMPSGGAAPGAGSGKMPSPEDLPPAGKKK